MRKTTDAKCSWKLGLPKPACSSKWAPIHLEGHTQGTAIPQTGTILVEVNLGLVEGGGSHTTGKRNGVVAWTVAVHDVGIVEVVDKVKSAVRKRPKWRKVV